MILVDCVELDTDSFARFDGVFEDGFICSACDKDDIPSFFLSTFYVVNYRPIGLRVIVWEAFEKQCFIKIYSENFGCVWYHNFVIIYRFGSCGVQYCC